MDYKKWLKVAAGVTVAVAAPPATLYLLGFSGGVGAGTVAAAVQAKIGSVAAGSLFATCQSVGAAGMAAGTKTALGMAGGYAAHKLF